MAHQTTEYHTVTKKYYIQNMCWGWFYTSVFFYYCWNDNFKYRLIFLLLSIFGFIFYPVAKWITEYFFLKFTTPQFWKSGFFIDTPGRTGLLAIYGCSVFLLSLPIIIIFYYFYSYKKATTEIGSLCFYKLSPPKQISFFSQLIINQYSGAGHYQAIAYKADGISQQYTEDECNYNSRSILGCDDFGFNKKWPPIICFYRFNQFTNPIKCIDCMTQNPHTFAEFCKIFCDFC